MLFRSLLFNLLVYGGFSRSLCYSLHPTLTFLGVQEHTLCDFNSLTFIDPCFMARISSTAMYLPSVLEKNICSTILVQIII